MSERTKKEDRNTCSPFLLIISNFYPLEVRPSSLYQGMRARSDVPAGSGSPLDPTEGPISRSDQTPILIDPAAAASALPTTRLVEVQERRT